MTSLKYLSTNIKGELSKVAATIGNAATADGGGGKGGGGKDGGGKGGGGNGKGG